MGETTDKRDFKRVKRIHGQKHGRPKETAREKAREKARRRVCGGQRDRVIERGRL